MLVLGHITCPPYDLFLRIFFKTPTPIKKVTLIGTKLVLDSRFVSIEIGIRAVKYPRTILYSGTKRKRVSRAVKYRGYVECFVVSSKLSFVD